MELKKLLDAIAALTALMQTLLAVLERETTEMGVVNIDAMADSNREKEDLIEKIAAQEQLMKQAITGLIHREGLPADTSFGTLATSLAQRGDRELFNKRLELKSSAHKIQQVAVLNREIAEKFSSTVATTLTLITRLANQSNVYGSSGGYQQPRNGAVMINMEA